jgi:hypothetical protein
LFGLLLLCVVVLFVCLFVFAVPPSHGGTMTLQCHVICILHIILLLVFNFVVDVGDMLSMMMMMMMMMMALIFFVTLFHTCILFRVM